jgi:MFS family permease
MGLFRITFQHIRDFPPALWVVIGASLLNQLGNMAFVFLVLYLTKHMGFSLAEASFAFAAFSASMLISGLSGGNLIDRIGAAPVMTTSLCANGLILIIFPYLHDYVGIILLCVGWGFAFGLYRPASSTLVAQLSKPGLHKITFSVYRLALNLGMSLGPALAGYLASHSFPAIFITNGITNLVASLVLLIGLHRTVWHKQRPALQHKMELSIKWLKRDAALRYFLLSMIPLSMVFYQHESTLAVFLNRDLNLPLSFYGLLFTLNTLIIVFFELPLNVVTMNWPYRLNFLLGSAFITLGFAGMAFATLEWHIILLTLCWTLGEMILYPAASSYIADIAPEKNRGSYMSLFSTSSNVAMLLGPWGGAIVMEYRGASGLWLACGVLGIVSMLMFHFQREPEKQPH